MKLAFPSLFSQEVLWLGAAALAAGLVVAWILRGAPPGQAATAEDDTSAPRSGYRDRMIAGVVVGLLLIVGGAYAALSRGILSSVPIFALGFGVVIFLIARNQRFRHASPSLRRTIDFSTTFLNASLLAGILIVGNVIAFRYGGQPLDMTREGSYSLSTETTALLSSLDRPVKFTLFFGQGSRAGPQRDRVKQLLDAYKSTKPDRVELDSLDPFNDVARYEELAKRVPELELLTGGGVVIEYGTGEAAPHAVVRNQDLFLERWLDPARRSDGRASSFNGEDEITTALLRLKEGQKTKVAFSVGHGEPSISDLNPRGRGIGNWRARFNKVGCEVVELNLLSDEIPTELALMIVVGPKSPFKPEEIQKLRSFTDRRKPLLLLLGNSEPSGLDEFLKSYNLSIGKGIIVDRALYLSGNPALVLAPTEPALKHPMIDALGANRAVLLPGAAPIHIAGSGRAGASDAAPVDPALVPVAFLRTSGSSWAESDPTKRPLTLDRNTDEAGPLLVGVAVAERGATNEPANASSAAHRLVLFSCPAMAENFFQDIERTNLDILMLAAGWLRGRPDTMGIAPKHHIALTLTADPELRQRLILIPSFVALMSIIAMGVIVYTARRE
jgi:gliding motility-associatede transport system auxiliary component